MIALKDMEPIEAQNKLKSCLQNMQSVEMIDLAEILFSHSYESFDTEELMAILNKSHSAVKSMIDSLRNTHGLDIINLSQNAVKAKYKLVGFKEPQKKAKQTKKKVKLSIPTPSPFNPLIAQVFA